MRRSLVVGTAVGSIVALGFVATPAQALSPTTADLYVLHAVPATPVDVYVNGALTLDDFQPGALAGPLDLAAGTYSVAITAADAADAGAPVIGPIDLVLAAGTSYTAVAHLGATGTPTATLFTNDLAKTAPGQGRLTVRHVAAAPAVDVLAGGSPVISNLSNPAEAKLDLAAGTVSAAVAATGTTNPVIGPTDVAIQDGVNTILYAWGSLEAGTLAIAAQTIGGLHSAPNGVPAGEAGLVADPDPAPFVWGVAAMLVLLAATAALTLAKARAARRETPARHGRADH
jgi:hypothetical protein